MAVRKRKQKTAPKKTAKPRAQKKPVRAALPLRDARGRFKAKPKRTAKHEHKAQKPVAAPRKPQAKRAPKPPANLHAPAQTPAERPGKLPKLAPLPKAPDYARQTFKAKVGQAFSAPQYDVTTGEERAVTTHIALREKAAKEHRFVVPSQVLRHVADPYRQALKKSATVGRFLTDANVEEITYAARKALEVMSKHAPGKINARYVLELNMSEYGIELQGSDKGEIARVDGLRSEALHWTKQGTRARPTVEGALTALDDKLGDMIKRRGRTTIVIETITVTLLSDRE